MTDEEETLVQELVDSLDGTCLHEWELDASAAMGGLIATTPSGKRFAISIEAWKLATLNESGGSRG